VHVGPELVALRHPTHRRDDPVADDDRADVAPLALLDERLDQHLLVGAVEGLDDRLGDLGRDHVSFTIHPWQATDEDAVGLTLPVHDRRSVRSSSGHAEDRIVVLMRLTLARRRITAEVTLTDRDEMGFRMLVGRQALEQAFLVDSRLSYAGGRPARATRRKNWGRA